MTRERGNLTERRFNQRVVYVNLVRISSKYGSISEFDSHITELYAIGFETPKKQNFNKETELLKL